MMNFILSKIINRPKSVVLSADQMDSNKTTSPPLLPPPPQFISSSDDDRGVINEDLKNKTTARSITKKSLPVEDLVVTGSSPVPFEVSNITSRLDKSDEIKERVVKGEGEGVLILTTNENEKNNSLTFKDKNIDAQKELNGIIPLVDGKKDKHPKATSVLPDIINVQPVKGSEIGADDSLISSLANNLNNCHLNTTKDSNFLNIPTSNYDGISSDEELYAECQTFTESTNNFEMALISPSNNTTNNDKSWVQILSNVESTTKENLHQINSNLDLYTTEGSSVVPVVQEEEFISPRDEVSLEPEKNQNSVENDHEKKKEADKSVSKETVFSCESGNDVCSQAEQAVQADQEKELDLNLVKLKTPSKEETEVSDLSKSFNVSNDVKSDSTFLNDSMNCSDIYIPQVLLLQKGEKNKNENTSSDTSNKHEDHEMSKEIAIATFNKSEEDIFEAEKECLVDKNVLHGNNTSDVSDSKGSVINEDVVGKPLETSDLSQNSKESKHEISSELKDEVSSICLKAQTTSLSKCLESQNVLDNLEETSGEIILNKIDNISSSSAEHSCKSNSPKVFDRTYDNADPINQMNGNPGLLLSPVNITFAASSEAINSTVNMPLHRENNQLDGSFDAENSFNKNETVPIDWVPDNKHKELEKEKSSTTVSTDGSLEFEIVTNVLGTSSPRIINNDSVEPMDVDISPEQKEQQAQKLSPSPKGELCQVMETSSSVKKQLNFPVEEFNANTAGMDFEFKAPSFPVSFQFSSKNGNQMAAFNNEEFRSSGEFILSSTAFDFLSSKDSTIAPDRRDSLLLQFDPLLAQPVPVNQSIQHQQDNRISQQFLRGLNTCPSSFYQERLCPTVEEGDDNDDTLNNKQNDQDNIRLNETVPSSEKHSSINSLSQERPLPRPVKSNRILNLAQENKNNDKMSVSVIQEIKIENDVKCIDDLSTQTEEKQDYKMEDLEKKIKNEVLKTEDIEKKLKDSEQREEALLKRITDKDKTIAKMSGVIEAYEKALAELIAEKEQIKQNYEKQIEEIKSERDSNAQHLLSLESTFADLHLKYERSKQVTEKLKKNEQELANEKNQSAENLRLQEQRYEKMKNHALKQLEIANNKLETSLKNHTAELTKLKALLKKEEISRLSIAEQLQQKTRENEELMKICDELINSQGS